MFSLSKISYAYIFICMHILSCLKEHTNISFFMKPSFLKTLDFIMFSLSKIICAVRCWLLLLLIAAAYCCCCCCCCLLLLLLCFRWLVDLLAGGLAGWLCSGWHNSPFGICLTLCLVVCLAVCLWESLCVVCMCVSLLLHQSISVGLPQVVTA